MRKFNDTLRNILAAALLILAGRDAMAQHSTFTVTCSTNGFFTIERSDKTKAETVRVRTVGLSAYPGTHFTEYVRSETFDVGKSSKTIQITTPALDETQWGITHTFQEGSTRSYRFEVRDEEEREILASYTRSIPGETRQFSDAYISNGERLVYFDSSSLEFASDVPSDRYYDHHVLTADHWYKVDDGDDYEKLAVTTSTDQFLVNVLGISNSKLRKYYDIIGDRLYATVCFNMYEENDGYQYIQILVDNSSTYDGKDPDGNVNTPSKSVYKACFILSYNEDVCSNSRPWFFPHRYDYVDKAAHRAAFPSLTPAEIPYEFSITDNHLYKQLFNTGDWNYRASNAGALLLNVYNHNITIRFDANGSGADTWYYKNMFIRYTIADVRAPTFLGNPRLTTGYNYRGTETTINIPFSEIVRVTGTPTLSTTWGTFTYEAGSGSNVLAFTGTIDAPPGTELTITGCNGTIKDLGGNAFSWPGSLTLSEHVGTCDSVDDFARDEQGRYLISNKEELYKLRRLQRAGKVPEGSSFLQTADIVCDSSYQPIGDSYRPFMSSYDGGGHTLSGITVETVDGMVDGTYLGVFGFVKGSKTASVVIKDIILSDSLFKGYQYVGGIAGFLGDYATIENCRVESTVKLLAGSSNPQYFGGIAGSLLIGNLNSFVKVEGCVSAATISFNNFSGYKYFGGLVGHLSSYYTSSTASVVNCLYIGSSLSGGTNSNMVDTTVGQNNGTTTNCYHTNSSLSGKRPGYTITPGSNVKIDGSQTRYDVSGLTAIGSTVLKLSNNKYYSGKDNSITLAYTGTGTIANGNGPIFSVNGTEIVGNTFTMPAENVTVSVRVGVAPILTLSAVEADLLGETKYVATFYQGTYAYEMPEGVQAYTAILDGSNVVFRLIGDDGRILPPATAAILVGNSPEITITRIESTTVAAREGNILRGSDSAIGVSVGTPYVLGLVDGKAAFCRSGTRIIPAGKAYYVK